MTSPFTVSFDPALIGETELPPLGTSVRTVEAMHDLVLSYVTGLLADTNLQVHGLNSGDRTRALLVTPSPAGMLVVLANITITPAPGRRLHTAAELAEAHAIGVFHDQHGDADEWTPFEHQAFRQLLTTVRSQHTTKAQVPA